MSNAKVFSIPVARVFPLLIAKAERRGCIRAEVCEVTAWTSWWMS